MVEIYYGKIIYTNKKEQTLTSFSDSPIHIAYLIDNLISKEHKHIQGIKILNVFIEDEFLECFKKNKNKNKIPICFYKNKTKNTVCTNVLPYFKQYIKKSESELLKIYDSIPNCIPTFKRFLFSEEYELKIKEFIKTEKYKRYLSKINESTCKEVYYIEKILSCKNNEQLFLTNDDELNNFNISNKYYENQIKNLVGNTWSNQISLIKQLQKESSLHFCFYFNNKEEYSNINFDSTNKQNILSLLYEIINISKHFNILNTLNCFLSIKQNTSVGYKRFTVIDFSSSRINKYKNNSLTEIEAIRTFINNNEFKDKNKIIPIESCRFMKVLNFNLNYSNG